MCTHFHYPLDMTLVTSCELRFPIISPIVLCYVAIIDVFFFIILGLLLTINKLITRNFHIQCLIFNNELFFNN